MDISEKDVKTTIECTLLSGGPEDCPETFWTGREKPRPYSGYAPGGYRGADLRTTTGRTALLTMWLMTGFRI